MENTIIYEGKELKWEYKICACLDCPLYPRRKEWENEPDIRKNKCYTSRCTYDRTNGKIIAEGIYAIIHPEESEKL
jgi:hypothetical protein